MMVTSIAKTNMLTNNQMMFECCSNSKSFKTKYLKVTWRGNVLFQMNASHYVLFSEVNSRIVKL